MRAFTTQIKWGRIVPVTMHGLLSTRTKHVEKISYSDGGPYRSEKNAYKRVQAAIKGLKDSGAFIEGWRIRCHDTPKGQRTVEDLLDI